MTVPGISQSPAISDQNTHNQDLEHEAVGKGLRPIHLCFAPTDDIKPSIVTGHETTSSKGSEKLQLYKHTEKTPSLTGSEKTGSSKSFKKVLSLVDRKADNSCCSAQTKRSSINSTGDLFLAAKSFEYNDVAVLPPILSGLIESHNRKNIILAVVKVS